MILACCVSHYKYSSLHVLLWIAAETYGISFLKGESKGVIWPKANSM